MVEPAREHDALAQRARRRRGSARAPRRPARRGTRAGGAAAAAAAPVLERPARARDLARALEVALGERREQPLEAVAVGAEADDHQARARHALEHERPGGEQQVDALAHDQLAHERDELVVLRTQALERGSRLALVAGERARGLS